MYIWTCMKAKVIHAQMYGFVLKVLQIHLYNHSHCLACSNGSECADGYIYFELARSPQAPSPHNLQPPSPYPYLDHTLSHHPALFEVLGMDPVHDARGDDALFWD